MRATLKELADRFNTTKATITARVRKLEKDYPEIAILTKENGINYITESGIKLLIQNIETDPIRTRARTDRAQNIHTAEQERTKSDLSAKADSQKEQNPERYIEYRLIEHLESEIEYLKEQLRIKDKEIQRQNKEIERLISEITKDLTDSFNQTVKEFSNALDKAQTLTGREQTINAMSQTDPPAGADLELPGKMKETAIEAQIIEPETSKRTKKRSLLSRIILAGRVLTK